MNTRLLLLLGGIAAAVVLFLLLRPGGDDETAGPPPRGETTTETTTTQEEADETTTAEAATITEPGPQSPRRFRIDVRNAQPVGGVQRLRAEQGERVVLVVRSDVADHVHLHGYDLMEDVGPGLPATISFRANLTGRFEIELEDRHVSLAELAVRP